MIRLLKEHYWLEAHAGCGPVLTDPRHVIVGDKVYVPRVRERLQYMEICSDSEGNTYPNRGKGWIDIPTVESPLPEPPRG